MGPDNLHVLAEDLVSASAAVLNSMNHSVVVWDTGGRLLFVNREASETFLWDQRELVGALVAERLVPAADVPFAREVVRDVEAGAPWSGDLALRRGDGAIVRTAVNLSPLRTADGLVVGAIATAEDVSVQRARESRSKKMVNYLLQALAGGEVGTFNWEFASNAVSWDEVAAAIFDVPAELDIVTFDEWLDLVDDHDRDLVLEARTEAAASDQYYRATYRLALADGEVRWIEERGAAAINPDGTISGIVGVVADATSRIEHEQEVAARAREAHRLAAEETEQRTRLEFLTEIDKLALHASDHRDLMHQLATACVPYLSDWCSIHFCAGGSKDHTFPEVVVAHRDPSRVDLLHQLLVKHPPTSALPVGAGAVIRNDEAQHLTDFSWLREHAFSPGGEEWEDDAQAFFAEFDPVSLVAVPLRTSSGLIGAIQFVTDMSQRVLTASDLPLIETTANRIAEALEATWLRDEQRTLAATLQSALLPPRLRRIEGIDLAVRYWVAGAMSEVGGDFYDLYPLADTPAGQQRWVVLIGDVCGTGPAAAAVTAIARHTVRAAARHGASHREVLEWLNEAILLSDRDRFCTLVYSTLTDNGDGTWLLESVSGGHPLPVLVDGDGAARPIGEYGTLMGILPEIHTHTERTVLRPGDTVVLYTDGFTDVAGSYGIEEDELFSMLETVHAQSHHADEFADQFGAAVEEILPMAQRDDDMALLVLRVGERTDADADALVLLGDRRFEPVPQSVAAARRFVHELIGQIANSDAILLGVSELATNAVIHAQSDFRVCVHASHSVIRVEVSDSSPQLPVVGEPGPNGVGGRGIRILEHLSTRWGVEDHDGAKTVWFELHGPQLRRVRRAPAN
ncbi:MAG: SpoIIE family protein phosphatase [Actinobacteria bacterium]|nr:SpoIIE family protein phosphatase [Actinomycetota bacterium]